MDYYSWNYDSYRSREREFKIVAGALSAKAGVKIVRRGFTWCSDPSINTIYVPMNAMYSDKTLGIMIHEAAHLRFSQMPVDNPEDSLMEKFSKTGKNPKQVWSLFQALEDFRIENEMGKLYPGTEKYLLLSSETTIDEIFENMDYYRSFNTDKYQELAQQAWRQFILVGYFVRLGIGADCIQAYSNAKNYSRHINNLAVETHQQMQNDGVDLYQDALKARSTADIFNLMERIFPYYLPLCDDYDPESEENNEKSIDQMISEILSIIKQAFQEYQDELNESQKNGGSMKKEIDQTNIATEDQMSAKDYRKKIFMGGVGFGTDYQEKPIDEDDLRNAVNAKLSQMRNAISILKDKERTRLEGNFDSGKLMNRKLHRLPTGFTRVFERRAGEKLDNTDMAVALVVDRSGSMSGQQANDACIACALFGKSLEITGKAFAVYGFDDKFYVHKTWNQKMVYAEMTKLSTTSGGTDDANAIYRARKELMTRPEQSKILIILTDGQGATSPFPEVGILADEVAKTQKIARVFAIGIRTDYVSQVYPESTHIMDSSELPGVMTEFFKKVVGKRIRV